MWDGPISPFTEGEWDYFDFNGALPEETPGNTFGGVSGGGLWRVQIYPHPEKDEVASTVVLEGVRLLRAREPPWAKASSVATV